MTSDLYADGTARRHPTNAVPSQTIGRRVAVRRLEAALIEQARVGDVFERSVGTSAEHASYSRLRAASERVAECDRYVKSLTYQPEGVAGDR